jgi:hypothetical protein
MEMSDSPIPRRYVPHRDTTPRQNSSSAATPADVMTIVCLCLIGLLLSLYLILRFPEFGAVIEQYNQF